MLDLWITGGGKAYSVIRRDHPDVERKSLSVVFPESAVETLHIDPRPMKVGEKPFPGRLLVLLSDHLFLFVPGNNSDCGGFGPLIPGQNFSPPVCFQTPYLILVLRPLC